MRDRANTLGILVWLAISLLIVIAWYGWVPEAQAKIALTSLKFGLMSALVAVPIGFLLAWLEWRLQSILATVIVVAMLSLLLIPIHLSVAVWDAALGKLGWYQGIEAFERGVWFQGFRAAVFVQSAIAIPWCLLIAFVGIRSVGNDLEQVACLDAKPLTVFFRITLRQYLPFMFLATIWCVLIANREIAVTDIYQVGTFAEEVYLQFSGGRFDWFGVNAEADSGESSLSIGVFVLSTVWIVVTAFVCLFCWLPAPSHDQFRCRTPPVRGLSRWAGKVFVVICGLLFVVIPLTNLVIRAGLSTQRVDGEAATTFSFGHFAETLQRVFPSYREDLSWSLLIGLATAIVATSIALLASLRKTRSGKRGRLWLVVIAISLAVPGPIVGVLVSRLFIACSSDAVDQLYNRTITAPVLATIIVAVGPAVAMMLIIRQNVSYESIEAAQLDGASSSQSERRMLFGQQLLGVAGCFLMTFLIGFGDLSASYIPMPAGMDTVGRRILGQMHAGVNDMTAALSLVCWIFTGTISLLTIFLLRKAGRRMDRPRSTDQARQRRL